MKKDILISIAWGVGMVLLSLGAKFARGQGYIDGDTLLRIVAMNGLFVAWMGNQLPKAVVPYAWAQRSRRFSGWTLVVGGLLFAGLWAFAPIHLARILGTGALAACLVLSIGYCFWTRGRGPAGA